MLPGFVESAGGCAAGCRHQWDCNTAQTWYRKNSLPVTSTTPQPKHWVTVLTQGSICVLLAQAYREVSSVSARGHPASQWEERQRLQQVRSSGSWQVCCSDCYWCLLQQDHLSPGGHLALPTLAHFPSSVIWKMYLLHCYEDQDR